MPSIAELLVQSTEMEVEAGGLRWRVRAIDNRRMAELGFGLLVAVAGDENKGEKRRQTGQELSALALRRQRMVIAGTTDVARPGEDWQPIHLVEDGKPEDPAANRIAVTRLPVSVFDVLCKTIDSLSAREGLATTRLLSFLGGS